MLHNLLSNPYFFFGSAFIVGGLVCSQIPRIEGIRAKHLEPGLNRVIAWLLKH